MNSTNHQGTLLYTKYTLLSDYGNNSNDHNLKTLYFSENNNRFAFRGDINCYLKTIENPISYILT